jgi:hypothetical protein
MCLKSPRVGEGGRGRGRAGMDVRVRGRAGTAGIRVCDGVSREYIKGEVLNVMSDAVLVARAKLRRDVDKVYRNYQGLVETVKENARELGRVLTGTRIPDGEILDGLNILNHFLKDNMFLKGEDTMQCCAALRRWTKYLACDDKYKKAVVSKDDRFKRIYRNNYKFRRQWVAFLREVADYVELMYNDKGEWKMHAIQAAMERMTCIIVCGGRVFTGQRSKETSRRRRRS